MTQRQFKTSSRLLMCIALTLSMSVNAQNTPATPSEVEPADLQDMSLDRIVDEFSDDNGALGQLQKQVDRLCEPPSDKKDPTARDIANPTFLKAQEQYKTDLSRKLEKELARYRIQFSLGDLSNLIDTKFFTTGVGYQYVVEPAFRNNEQLRKDIWSFNLGLRSATRVSVGTGVTVRITFSRFYGGPDAKWNAVKACPYLPSQMPVNSNDVKSKLRVRDGFRLEIVGSSGINTAHVVDSGANGYVSGGINTRALFLMDLYKVGQKLARVRLTGIKNKGELNLGLSLKSTSPFDLFSNRLNEFFTLGLGGSASKSISSIFRKTSRPVDSMMVDYLFNFSTADKVDLEDVRKRSDTAESALEQLFMSIRKAGFVSLFFSRPGSTPSAEKSVARQLLSKIQIAEALSKQDQADYSAGRILAKDIRIRSFFKGRLQSNLFAGEGRLWMSELIKKRGQVGSLDSFVTSFDQNTNPRYYYLYSHFQRGQTRKYFGRKHYNMSHDFDLLAHADSAGNIGRLTDVVLRTELNDTDLEASEIRDVKESLARSLPTSLRNDPRFEPYFPTAKQYNARLSHRYTFAPEALDAIGKYDKNELGQMIFEFLESHPEQKYMHSLPGRNSSGEHSSGGLGSFALEKAYQINSIVREKATGEEVVKAFRIANRDPIFEKYFIGELFPRLLPPDVASKHFGLLVKFSSQDYVNTKDLTLGGRAVSPVYEAVSFLKSIVSNPSFDLQMEEQPEGSKTSLPEPLNLGGSSKKKILSPVPEADDLGHKVD
jgi:hypothetical protein